MTMLLKALLACLFLLLALVGCKPVMFAPLQSDWDAIVNDPAGQQFIKEKYLRARCYAPFCDRLIGPFQSASQHHTLWEYTDINAIYPGDPTTYQLRDMQGNLLYMRGFTNLGTADFGNPEWRAQMIRWLQDVVRAGYKGVFLDDVNTFINTVRQDGTPAVPRDPRTGQQMTLANWQRYLAEFVEQIKAALLSDIEVIGNIVWFHEPNWRTNPYVQRILDALDVIEVERGFNDPNINATQFVELGDWIDAIHAKGKAVALDVQTTAGGGRRYALATYLLHREGWDSLGSVDSTKPHNWWAGYEVDLGNPTGKRFRNADGTWSREFDKDGVISRVTVNPTTRAATIPGVQ